MPAWYDTYVQGLLNRYMRYEVLTAVKLLMFVFWVVMLYVRAGL
jgi:hypothetical protein